MQDSDQLGLVVGGSFSVAVGRAGTKVLIDYERP